MPRTARWLLVIIWMAIIFVLSNQANSADETLHLFGDANFWVRKLAHASEFGVLFVLVRFALLPPVVTASTAAAQTGIQSGNWLSVESFLAFIITVFYASSDEWHQMFVVGRSALISDVLIDAIGALLAWAAVGFWTSWRRRQRSSDHS
jgi:VanZ family protein